MELWLRGNRRVAESVAESEVAPVPVPSVRRVGSLGRRPYAPAFSEGLPEIVGQGGVRAKQDAGWDVC